MTGFFEGFTLERIDVGEVTLRVRHAGAGSPVVLLHGHPRTHATWHRVAPLLASRHTVVCPDLRGYGRSTLPPDEPGDAQSSKRAMAADVVALMRHLGHERFAVVGHDRGSLVALRAALDHPDRVAGDHGRPAGGRAHGAAQRGVRARLVALVVHGADGEAGRARHLRGPGRVVHGRPQGGLPDALPRGARRRHRHPRGPRGIWRTWVSGRLSAAVIPAGHHQAEEAPDEVATALLEFLA